MKHLKLFVMTLALVMGISMTSCLNDDSGDSTQQVTVLARLTSTIYTSPSFVMADGTKLVFSDPTITALLDPGLYQVSIQFSYDDWDTTNGTILCTLLATPSKVTESFVSPVQESIVANAPLYALSLSSTNGSNSIFPYLFDKSTLILPVMYWYKNESDSDKLTAELNKHRFVMEYEPIESDDDVLTLNVKHVISGDSEDEEVTRVGQRVDLRAYNLSNAVMAFQVATNNAKLNKIVIKAQCNLNSNALHGAEEKTFELDCSQIEF